jgi:hypothetical protein
MTRPELLEKVLSGWFAIVGEFRGWNASSMGHLDRKTGLASKRVVLTFVVECMIGGGFGIVKIMQRLPEAVTDPSQVKVELERGKRYAFEVDSLAKENGFATAWMGLHEPLPIDESEAGGVPRVSAA